MLSWEKLNFSFIFTYESDKNPTEGGARLYLSVGFDSRSVGGGSVPLRGHISFGCLGSHCLRGELTRLLKQIKKKKLKKERRRLNPTPGRVKYPAVKIGGRKKSGCFFSFVDF